MRSWPSTGPRPGTGGGGDIGTEDQNTSTFAGRQTELTYAVQELVPNKRIALRGENATVIAHDTITFRQVGSQTKLTYTADFTFKGAAQLIASLMKPAFSRLGDQAEAGLAFALARL